MDKVLAQSWCVLCLTGLLLLSCSASLTLATDCLNFDTFWVNPVDVTQDPLPGYAACNINDSGTHFWWRGHDICDRESFTRLTGTDMCRDGDDCIVQPNVYYQTNSTYICCTASGIELTNANVLQAQCTQISVCPIITSVVVPPIITTDTLERAYITITSKPYLDTQPFNLDLSVDGNDVSYTTHLVEPSSAVPPELVYIVEFMVPRSMITDGNSNLVFSSFYLNRVNFGSSCRTHTEPVFTNSRIIPNIVEPATTASSTETPTQTDDGCVALGIMAGVSIAMLVIGLLVGLIIALSIWCCWCACGRKKYTCSKDPRALDSYPPPPPPNHNNGRPSLQLPTSFAHQMSTTSATPTPTDQSRLLAGQTPTTQPFFTGHPLDHGASISPYASTEEACKTREAYVSGAGLGTPAVGSGLPSYSHNPPRMSTTSPCHAPVPRSMSPAPLPQHYTMAGEDINLRTDVGEVVV